MSTTSLSSSSTSGSTSKLPSLFSSWKKTDEHQGHIAPKPRVVDPASINHPHMNPAAPVQPHSPTLMQERDNGLSEFFGGRALGSSRAHAASSPGYTMGSDIESLPSINKESQAVDPRREYPTTARYVFFYGFLFPPLWLVGIFILMMPLKAPAEWEGQKSTEEQTHLLAQMRFAERKWGKRCAFAFGLLVALVVIIAVAVWAALQHRN